MARRINRKQLTRLYWPAWRAAEKVLLANHHDKAEAEEIRKQIHVEITGSACSSKDLSDRQLDRVLGRFDAISKPSDGAAQARHADQPMARIRFKIAEIRKRMDLPDAYVDAMARRIAKRPLEHCSEDGLRDVLAALVKHEQRHAGDAPASNA